MRDMATSDSIKLVKWSEKYSVGIARIDGEHQKLIELVNELYSAMLGGQAKDVVGKTLDGLASYTVSHFVFEESLMKTHAYPEFQQHKEQHDKLVEQVKLLQADLRAGKPAVSKEVMAFLQQWLLGHILGVDKKYSAHLHAAGVK